MLSKLSHHYINIKLTNRGSHLKCTHVAIPEGNVYFPLQSMYIAENRKWGYSYIFYNQIFK